ncbi:MAG: T9SS type B sorting domain-containing protein [Terrimonas sp.]|nr:T9SS type B sorting domain-containing protein [Terrimonas sp.]
MIDLFKTILFIACFSVCNKTDCQTFLNGDFEMTSATEDEINLPNNQYNSLMSQSYAFGSLGNIDIIRSDSFCGPAQQGIWFIAITGGGSDALSLKLSSPLVAGTAYVISFFDRLCPPASILPNPVQVGVSDQEDQFGTPVFTAGIPTDSWTQRKFSFIAPSNGQFITVRVENGNSFNTWCQLDNFSFECNIDLDIGADTLLCEGEQLLLQTPPVNASLLWQDGSTNPTMLALVSGHYWVRASNDYCVVTDSIQIVFDNCLSMPHIPSGFTPNGDGKNDLFRLLGTVSSFDMKIFNRWGNLLFHSNVAARGWDGRFEGKEQPPGTYVYIIRYTTVQGDRKTESGILTLIR